MGFVARSGVLGVALAAAFGWGVGWAPVGAQMPSVVLTEPAGPLLPREFGGWRMQGAASTSNQPAIEAVEADAVRMAALKEDGLRRYATAAYMHGAATLEVRAMQFADATGAAAGFSLYRAADAGLRPLPSGERLGTESAVSADGAVFRTGNTLVIAKGPHVEASELQGLASTLPKISGPKGMSPLLPTLLPVKGLEAESVRYSLGPVGYVAEGGVLPAELLGFDKSAEEVTANYAARGGKGTLTMLLYPTPQIAGDRGRALESWVNARHDKSLGTVLLRREGPLVLMTTGGFAHDDAQRMIENVHLRSEVTWDKKLPLEFHSEIQKTYSLLTSIVVLSGVLMAAAVLLGLFLGFGRASLRVWMGKPAALEMEFLGLGLEPGPAKRLRASDDPA